MPCCQQDLFKRRSSAAAGETPISSFFIKSFPHNRPVQDGKNSGTVSVVCQKNGARRERHSVERHRLALGRSSPQENEVQRRNPLLFIPRLPPKVVRKRATFAVKILRSAGRREGEALHCFRRLFKQGGADRERRFAVSLTGIELLQPKNLPPEGFSGLRGTGVSWKPFLLQKVSRS